MRIAVIVISLVLMVLLFAQSCTVTAGGSLAEDESISSAGAVGLLVAFLFLLGGAFVMGMPRLSAAMFWIAAFIGILAGLTTEFADLLIWGVVAVVLGIMARLSVRAPATDAVAADEAPAEQRAELTRMKVCPECAERVQPAAKVCRFCGFRFVDPEPAA